MAPNAISGITHIASNHSVDATVEKLTAILQSSGMIGGDMGDAADCIRCHESSLTDGVGPFHLL